MTEIHKKNNASVSEASNPIINGMDVDPSTGTPYGIISAKKGDTSNQKLLQVTQ